MTLEQRIEAAQNSLAAATTDEQKQLLSLGIEKLKEMLSQQKKSERQPSAKPEQLPPNVTLPTVEEMQEWVSKSEKQAKWNEIREKLPAMARAYDETIKTVKAPSFVAPDELINVTLEDAEGEEYTRTHTKAQVRALARKYFSNVHESWQGKEKKMKRGFRNMLAYVVAWKEFDNEMPGLRDVLPDYDRYSKGGEDKDPSEAFKVAQELYRKISELLK